MEKVLYIFTNRKIKLFETLTYNPKTIQTNCDPLATEEIKQTFSRMKKNNSSGSLGIPVGNSKYSPRKVLEN